MKYMGSKNRIAKYLLPIILKNRKPTQYYVEPFVGGANMIDKVDGLRIGADSNRFVVDALLNIRDDLHILPRNNREFTELDYKDRSANFPEIKGFASFAYSYAGKFWGGWSRDRESKRDYVSEAYKNALKQSDKLKGLYLIHSNYIDLFIPKNSIIYCDPPYKNTVKYKDGDFDHEQFFVWCEDRANEGHSVFISEYNAPEDFICIWEKQISNSLPVNGKKKVGTEKLFVHNSQLKTKDWLTG